MVEKVTQSCIVLKGLVLENLKNHPTPFMLISNLFQVTLFPSLSVISSFNSLLTVYTNGSDHFVLRNASVQLTISKGRITSLVDVDLGYIVLRFLFRETYSSSP